MHYLVLVCKNTKKFRDRHKRMWEIYLIKIRRWFSDNAYSQNQERQRRAGTPCQFIESIIRPME